MSFTCSLSLNVTRASLIIVKVARLKQEPGVLKADEIKAI